MAEGAALIDDRDYLLLTLSPIAERLARDGEGVLAWQVVCRAELVLELAGGDSHKLRLRWIKGITYRALGQHRHAVRELEAVRDRLVAQNLVFRAALASLDLAAAYVALGRWDDVQRVVEDAHAVFIGERLERRALAAFLALRLAARGRTLTEALAVEVANYLVRSRHDDRVRFEPPREP